MRQPRWMFGAQQSWNNLRDILMRHLCPEICRADMALGHLLQNTSLLQRLQDTHVTLWSSSSHCLLKDEVIFHIIVLENNRSILSLKENKSFTRHRKQDVLASCLFTGWLWLHVHCRPGHHQKSELSLCCFSHHPRCLYTHRHQLTQKLKSLLQRNDPQFQVTHSYDLSGFEHRQGQTSSSPPALTTVPVAAFLTASGFAR